MKKVYILLYILLFISIDLFAQNTNVITKNIYTLKGFDGPLTNPHKGFTVPTEGTWIFDPAVEYGPYGEWHNQAWNLITYGSGYQKWSDLHKGQGVYDWTKLDELLEALAEHNMGYALRVFPYTTSFIRSNSTPPENYDWTPKYVYDLGAEKIQATVKGNSLLESGTKAQVPVWDDPIYLQAAKEFATALAEKYDGDPRIEYIDIRSFGEWGEWHVSNLVGSHMPSLEIQKEMVSHYASVFKKTQLVITSDAYGDIYTYALGLGVTKRDDGMIGIPGTADSLVRAYNANLPTIAENMGQYSIMLEYTDVIPGNYLKWTPQRWIDAIKTAHLTYYVLDQDDYCAYQFYLDNKELADSMTHVIGYNFKITNAELVSTATTNTLNLTVKNTGVAPCFFDVYMVAEFVDNSGVVLSKFGETISIPKKSFKDETTKEFSFVFNVPNGETNIATKSGVSVALSLYESEEAYLNGKNPTVRFDNDGIQANNKLLLPSCSHEFGAWDTTKVATSTETGLRIRVCTHENCKSYQEETIPTLENVEKTQTIQLKKGWNLMSINVHPSDSSIATLFSGMQVEIVKDNDGFWKKSKEDELQSLMSITAGKGYLVYMNEDGSLLFSGKPMTNITIPKQSGWNLIGTPFQTETPIESVFDANNCEMLINLDGKWQPAGTNNSLHNLKPGEGYFVK